MPRIRTTTNLTTAEKTAILRAALKAEPDHMLTERAILRHHLACVKTLGQASSLITEYERVYGPGCVRRGKLEGGKVRVVCLDPDVRARSLSLEHNR